MKKIIISFLSVLLLFILVLVVNFFIFQSSAVEISQGQPIVQSDTLKQAVLVIDIQEGTTGKASVETYYRAKSAHLIRTINQLADSSAKYNIPVIYVKNEITNFLINILNSTYAPGSQSSHLDERLHPASGIILNKDKSDAFTNPALDSVLSANKINTLIFTGLDISFCVNSTILAAQNRNYRIYVISDAVLGKSDSLQTAKLAELQKDGLNVIPSSESFDLIRQ